MRNTKEIIRSLAPLIIVIILFLIVGKFGASKAVEISGRITESTKEKNSLKQKLGLLRLVSDTVNDRASVTALALPDQNPSIVTISQLKFLATQNQILMLGMKSSPEVKDNSGLLRVDIAFEVDGDKPSIIDYINKIKTMAPITLIEKIKIAEINGVTRANVTVKSFWSPLPKTLPNLTTQIADLTQKEELTLTEISSLTPPQFVITSPSEAGEKLDPFTQ